jgi:hypothetical protein
MRSAWREAVKVLGARWRVSGSGPRDFRRRGPSPLCQHDRVRTDSSPPRAVHRAFRMVCVTIRSSPVGSFAGGQPRLFRVVGAISSRRFQWKVASLWKPLPELYQVVRRYCVRDILVRFRSPHRSPATGARSLHKTLGEPGFCPCRDQEHLRRSLVRWSGKFNNTTGKLVARSHQPRGRRIVSGKDQSWLDGARSGRPGS